MPVVQPDRLLLQIGKGQHHPFQGVALVGEFHDQGLLPEGGRGVFLRRPGLQQLDRTDPGQVDGQHLALAGGDEAELVVLGGVLQPVGHAVIAAAIFPVAAEPHPELPLFPHGLQDRPKPGNILFVIVGISIQIAVEINEGVRAVQRLHILQSFLRRRKEADPRILQQGFQPLLLQGGQGHGGRMTQTGAQILFQQGPAAVRQRGGDGQQALPEGRFLHDGGELFPCEAALRRSGEDRGDGVEIVSVYLTEQHGRHLRTAPAWRPDPRKTAA